MKYLLTFTLGLFLLVPVFSFAASYPASCPSEAQAIVDAVGGCSTISESEYGAIYEKCCSVVITPTPPPATKKRLIPTPKPVPSLTLLPASPEPSPQLASETSSSSETLSDDSSVILVLILILGGLAYLVIWFVRKRKKRKGSAEQAMPEKKCPYCKSAIPGDATRCSHCQANLRNWWRRHPIWTTILVLLSLLFIIGLVS